MSIFGALAATVPVLGSLWDPELQQQRKLEQTEREYMNAASKAEAAGDAAAATRHRGQARMTHNQRIRLAQDVERNKAVECRKHGWTQAANDHEQKAQQLEYEIWADTDGSATAPQSQPQPKQAAPVPSNTASSNATATPPPASGASSASSSSSSSSSVNRAPEGTSWPPQQQVAAVVPPVSPSLPPPPAYADVFPQGAGSEHKQS